jgi:26S proteasome regulatory subunit RPN6 N-terminal domain
MAPPPSNAARVMEAKELSTNNPSKAETIYKGVLSKAPGSNEQALRDYENSLVGLGELYRDNKKVDELAELVKSSRSTLSSFAKAKTAKLGWGEHILFGCQMLMSL